MDAVLSFIGDITEYNESTECYTLEGVRFGLIEDKDFSESVDDIAQCEERLKA